MLDQIAISVFVTGEYGEKTKRPHWHACIFNWAPSDRKHKYTSERGDVVYESESLSKLWPNGIAEFGEVTFLSAGYCARYAAKKLCHGNDQDHEYHPISKKSSKHAIGKRWLEKYWPDIFNYGTLEIEGRPVGSIPRYYEKWLQKNQPQAWEKYVTQTKAAKIADASKKEVLDRVSTLAENERRRNTQGIHFKPQITRRESQEKILEQKFNERLQDNLKL